MAGQQIRYSVMRMLARVRKVTANMPRWWLGSNCIANLSRLNAQQEQTNAIDQARLTQRRPGLLLTNSSDDKSQLGFSSFEDLSTLARWVSHLEPRQRQDVG